ncbi:hypothetical protein FQR65_LT20156 [Abscondita terminalis]|nr:hypothetical protein FQR65_LT20156 [Abscondita terminalis]
MTAERNPGLSTHLEFDKELRVLASSNNWMANKRAINKDQAPNQRRNSVCFNDSPPLERHRKNGVYPPPPNAHRAYKNRPPEPQSPSHATFHGIVNTAAPHGMARSDGDRSPLAHQKTPPAGPNAVQALLTADGMKVRAQTIQHRRPKLPGSCNWAARSPSPRRGDASSPSDGRAAQRRRGACWLSDAWQPSAVAPTRSTTTQEKQPMPSNNGQRRAQKH